MVLKIFFSILGVLTAFFMSAILYWSSLSDFDVQFSRQVIRKTPMATLEKSLNDLRYWPKWYFHLKRTEPTEGVPAVGSKIRLFMEPPGKEWKRYELEIQIEEYVPGKKFKARLLSDSSGKITRLFENVEWTLEFLPDSLVGTLQARTRHWKARVFSSFARKILMNQIYYVNLEKFAGFKESFNPDQIEVPSPPSPY